MSAPAGVWPLAEHGEFPDIEAVVVDLLSIDMVVPAGETLRVATWVPNDITGSFVHVYRARSVGGMNPGGWEDVSTVYISTWSDSRAHARQITREVRRTLGRYSRGGGHKNVLIDYAFEAAAPGNNPDEDTDARQVDSAWTFACRRHRGSTVYP